MVFILNKLIKRNEITRQNSFTILLFVIFTGFFQPILYDFRILITGFLLVLALRRAIGLRDKTDVKKKFFDISFWLAVMVFTFEASFPFLIIPFFAILLYEPERFRNWLIPVIGFIGVAILAICLSYLWVDSFFGLYNFNFILDFNFDAYREQGLILPLGIVLAFNIWLFLHFFREVRKAKRRNKASLYLIFWFWVAGIFTVFFTPEKNGSELIFLILPVSIAGSLYYQQKKELIFKEILLIAMLVFSLALPFLI